MYDIKTITPEEVTQILEELVAEYGEDFIYKEEERGGRNPATGGWNDQPSCRYFDDEGKPSCIVGHVLAECGITQVEEGYTASRVLRDLGASPSIIKPLKEAQFAQDEGYTWKNALAEYKYKLSEQGEN